jgi:hypothetical protein
VKKCDSGHFACDQCCPSPRRVINQEVRSNLYDEKVMQTSETFLCLVSFFGFVGHMSSKSRQSKEEERTAGEVVPPAVRSSYFYTFVWQNRFDSVR